MNISFGLFFLLVAAATALEDAKPTAFGVYDYHQRIGIPEAIRIKTLENKISQDQSRIVGGAPIVISAIPYQAGLLVTLASGATSVCGGIIISTTRILTAAHCYSDGVTVARLFTVVLGSNFLFAGGTRVTSNTVALHPGYNPRLFANDVAIISVNAFNLSPSIQPIALPSGSEINSTYAGNSAIASGYGITRDGEQVSLFQAISTVTLTVISNAECANTYGSIIQDGHMCTSGAGRVGICGGDTGGPFTTNVKNRTILIGVSSFMASSGCQAGFPSGFSRVTAYLSWINSLL